MFNTYARFLRDYGMVGLNPYFEYMCLLIIIWLLILAIKKVVRFPSKRSFKAFKVSIFLVMLVTVGFVIKERNNISLMVKPIKDDKQFVYELNKALKRNYKPEYEGKNYYISHIEEKVNILGTRKHKINNYFYKIDKVTTKNIVDTLNWFEKTKYASVSDFVHEIIEPEYKEYMEKIIEENKKAEAEAKRKEAEAKKKEEEAKKKNAEEAKKKREELKAKESNTDKTKVGEVDKSKKEVGVNSDNAKSDLSDTKDSDDTSTKEQSKDGSDKGLSSSNDVNKNAKSKDTVIEKDSSDSVLSEQTNDTDSN